MFNCNCATTWSDPPWDDEDGWCGEIAIQKDATHHHQCVDISYGYRGYPWAYEGCVKDVGNEHVVEVYCCASSNKGNSREYCPDRRRKRRSIPAALIEAYSGLYSHLVDLPALENFLAFDLDKDGLISFEEAILTTDNITTAEGFKGVDIDNDGFVRPGEFDLSLNI